MKTEKYIENKTIFEYIEYEARMKKQYVHPTRSKGVDFSYLSSKSVAKEYMYYSDDAKIDLYYELPLLLPYFQPIQPRAKSGYESPYVDIVGVTDSIAEYESEEGEQPGDGITNYTRRHHNSSSDGVTYFTTASARTDSNAYLEDSFHDGVLENQLLSASLLICLGKRDCVERIPLENVNPSSFPQEPPDSTHAKFMARINKLLTMRQTIDSFLFKTINEMNNQSSDSEIFYPKERIKELKLRTQQRNNFEEELFRDSFPTEKELAYHKELGETQPPFLTIEPKIRRSDPWSLKIPCAIGIIYMGHAYIDLQSPINIMSRAYYNKIKEKPFQARRNPYQPYKFYNFVGRAKNMHIFVGCFIYVVDFMILEDLGSIIDSGLSEVVLGKPFA
ncbi:hypothetical protein Tco_0732159 [Tanacetum coccineum]